MNAKIGQTGPILDIFFICIKINGNIVTLATTDVNKTITHHGNPIS
jgi:hypothetical protein